MLPPLDPLSDEPDLVRRVLSGERAAADEFFARHFRPLYEFAHYRMGSQPAEVVFGCSAQQGRGTFAVQQELPARADDVVEQT